MSNNLQLNLSGLFLPLRTTFKQASSVRNLGESIWCEATRRKLTGYGEGCPRIYVTGETVDTGLAWLQSILPDILANCYDLSHLKAWILENELVIDEHPAAFCAVETALLDLFAKENNQSVETLLGLNPPQYTYTYTAVLGDSTPEKFNALIQRYLTIGFADFKVKVNGDLRLDQQKLTQLQLLCQQKGLQNIRIRLDANNLWTSQTSTAIQYLAQLPSPIFGVEEPIEPKHYIDLSKISNTLDLPIILDESLCNQQDLKNLDLVSGKFIANLKVSRIGGILRTLTMIEALQKRTYPIIIGAHVGETSILTRAGMCAAQAAQPALVAQEGGFGQILLEKDKVQPSLMFGVGGKIDLRKPYPPKGTDQIVPNWQNGWGYA